MPSRDDAIDLRTFRLRQIHQVQPCTVDPGHSPPDREPTRSRGKEGNDFQIFQVRIARLTSSSRLTGPSCFGHCTSSLVTADWRRSCIKKQ